MALILDDLSALAYADGFTLWHYRSSSDSTSLLTTLGYFARVSHMLRPGDIILARGTDGAALLHVSGSGAALAATAF